MQNDTLQLNTEREQLGFQVKELTVGRNDLQDQIVRTQKEGTDARTALAVATREVDLATERLRRVEAHVEAIGQEKFALIEQQATLQENLKQAQELGVTKGR